MSIVNNLVREIKSLPRNPAELIIVLVLFIFLVDFLLKGQLTVIYHTAKLLKTVVKMDSWLFIAIILLILFWE